MIFILNSWLCQPNIEARGEGQPILNLNKKGRVFVKKILFLLMALVLLITGCTVAPVPACADVENRLYNCGIEETAHFVYTRYDVNDGRLYGIAENPCRCSRCHVRATFFFWDNTFHVIGMSIWISMRT